MKELAVFAVAVIIGATNVFLSGLVVYLAWESAQAIGLPEITYMQACGLVLITHSLQKSYVTYRNNV